MEKILYYPRSSALSPSLPRHTALRSSRRGRRSGAGHPTGTLQAFESRQHCVARAPYFGRRSRLGESAHPSDSPLTPRRIRSRLRSLLGESLGVCDRGVGAHKSGGGRQDNTAAARPSGQRKRRQSNQTEWIARLCEAPPASLSFRNCRGSAALQKSEARRQARPQALA